MVHTNLNLELTVLDVRTETPGHTSVRFHRPPNFDYTAGDWIDLSFPGVALSGGQTYSLSSAPREPFLMITFRNGVSELKQTLSAVKPGDVVVVSQYGNDYDFQLKSFSDCVLIAGGVGIAPFRSMIKTIADNLLQTSVQVLYFNKTRDFLFTDEFKIWSHQLPTVTIKYIETGGLKRKDRHAFLDAVITDSAQNFYIAGPPDMVTDVEEYLEANGVKPTNIKIDTFDGY